MDAISSALGPTTDFADSSQSETLVLPSTESLLNNIWRAAAVALVLSLPRAAFVLPRFGMEVPANGSLAQLFFLTTLLEGLLVCFLVSLALIVLAERWSRQRERTMGWIVSLPIIALGYLLITFRLPSSEFFAPAFDSTSALVAHSIGAVAALVAGLIARPRSKVPGLKLAGVLGFLLGVLCPALIKLSSPPPASWSERPNVVLISLDTLRADRLESYGYQRSTSSNIKRFFENGSRFEQAYAPQSFTLTSHATMFTGLEPTAHGVSEKRSLANNLPTLGSQMRAADYATLAIVDGCTYMDQRFGYMRGFELYRSVYSGAEQKIRYAKEMLDVVGDRPFMFFLHCFDAHSDFTEAPYEAAPEFLAEFAGSYDGDFLGCAPDGNTCASRYLQELNSRGEALGPEEQAWISDTYDAGIATMDRELDAFFEYLEETGRLENTVVILTSDHGEEFYEHGRAMHVQDYVESLHVPLMIRTPTSTAENISALVGTVDLTPTILDFCGLWNHPPPPHRSAGRSVLPLLSLNNSEHEFDSSRYLISESSNKVIGVRTEDGVLVRGPEGWELFDARTDPAQKENLMHNPDHQELAQEMAELLKESQGRVRDRRMAQKGKATTISAKEQAQLESLGYTGDE